MAFCDYHACDKCGEAKTFYDANMDYGDDESGNLVYGGYEVGGHRVDGCKVYAICGKCAKTHKIVIQPL